ncbi:hypothetical protein LF41_1390 [Lysobacter dokdonensis DS-58]|uniref:Uncharacterized protein n=1 Tax=Lysobacter dokdonensis DS-58 TaxID=1300345 RepID=A0A0A2WJE6_9GAMM|nr:hypothetical protein [Lysobacter dokdonensis]KGQ18390.1 hypothetical protein LF41_1390 [Lysobacter dokdonensis DS-58]
MRIETARLYKDLLSLQGHLVDGRIEDEITGTTPAPRRADEKNHRWFDSFLLLGGHDPIDPHQANDAIVSPERIGISHC